MSKRLDLKNVSEAFLRLNPQLAAMPNKPAKTGQISTFNKERINNLNKTERRYFDTFLSVFDDSRKVIVQPPRFFELKGGGTYTPDFLLFCNDGVVEVIEIKGGYKGPGAEQGIERYKRTAAQWSSNVFHFVMCIYDRKTGAWRREEWK